MIRKTTVQSLQEHAIVDLGVPLDDGYQALFGLKYIAPALGGITDYHGVAITGFQSLSFDPTPAQTLAVVEDMLKAGISVVYAYIADAHDNQAPRSLNSSNEGTFGPGEIGYVQMLADYNAAFGTFFQQASWNRRKQHVVHL